MIAPGPKTVVIEILPDLSFSSSLSFFLPLVCTPSFSLLLLSSLSSRPRVPTATVLSFARWEGRPSVGPRTSLDLSVGSYTSHVPESPCVDCGGRPSAVPDEPPAANPTTVVVMEDVVLDKGHRSTMVC